MDSDYNSSLVSKEDLIRAYNLLLNYCSPVIKEEAKHVDMKASFSQKTLEDLKDNPDFCGICDEFVHQFVQIVKREEENELPEFEIVQGPEQRPPVKRFQCISFKWDLAIINRSRKKIDNLIFKESDDVKQHNDIEVIGICPPELKLDINFLILNIKIKKWTGFTADWTEDCHISVFDDNNLLFKFKVSLKPLLKIDYFDFSDPIFPFLPPVQHSQEQKPSQEKVQKPPQEQKLSQEKVQKLPPYHSPIGYDFHYSPYPQESDYPKHESPPVEPKESYPMDHIHIRPIDGKEKVVSYSSVTKFFRIKNDTDFNWPVNTHLCIMNPSVNSVIESEDRIIIPFLHDNKGKEMIFGIRFTVPDISGCFKLPLVLVNDKKLVLERLFISEFEAVEEDEDFLFVDPHTVEVLKRKLDQAGFKFLNK